jgi:hypothetical protein
MGYWECRPLSRSECGGKILPSAAKTPPLTYHGRIHWLPGTENQVCAEGHGAGWFGEQASLLA